MSFPASITLPDLYENYLVQPLFRPFAERLLDRVSPSASDSLLDVACGTGIVARLARGRLGPAAKIAGVDVTPPMLAAARRSDATIDWRDGDAMKLPLQPGETFSIVTCHQGLQFMGDKPLAVRQMRTALRPGGRVAIATWTSIPDTPFMKGLDEVAQRHVGPFTDPRHGFGDGSALAALLADAGFRNVRADTFSHDVVFAPDPDYARMNAMAVIGMSPAGRAMDDAQRTAATERIVQESRSVVARFMQGTTLRFALTTNIATGTS